MRVTGWRNLPSRLTRCGGCAGSGLRRAVPLTNEDPEPLREVFDGRGGGMLPVPDREHPDAEGPFTSVDRQWHQPESRIVGDDRDPAPGSRERLRDRAVRRLEQG